MELSKSFMKGRKNNVAVKENFRDGWTEKDYERHNERGYSVYQERTQLNTVLIQPDGQNIHEIVNRLVADRVETYNAGKRPSRQIHDFYEKEIHGGRSGQTREIGFEYVVGIGSLEDFQTLKPKGESRTLHDFFKQEPERLKLLIDPWYKEFLANYQEQNPKLKVVSAVVHWDESTPHMHMIVVPWAERKNGIGVSLSLDTALKQQGLTFDKVTEKSPLEQYNANVHKILTGIIESKHLRVRTVGTRDKTLSVPELKQVKRAVEAEKERETELNSRISHLEAHRDVLEKETVNLSKKKQNVSNELLELSEEVLDRNQEIEWLKEEQDELEHPLDHLSGELTALRQKGLNQLNTEMKEQHALLNHRLTAKQTELETLGKNWASQTDEVAPTIQRILETAEPERVGIARKPTGGVILSPEHVQRLKKLQSAQTQYQVGNLITENTRLRQENKVIMTEKLQLDRENIQLRNENNRLKETIDYLKRLPEVVLLELREVTNRLTDKEYTTFAQTLGHYMAKTADRAIETIYDKIYGQSKNYLIGKEAGSKELYRSMRGTWNIETK